MGGAYCVHHSLFRMKIEKMTTEKPSLLANPLTIVYRDEYLVAVNKPEGLLVHKSNIDKNEVRYLLQMLRDQVGEYVYPIHRLDKPSSGLILFGLSAGVAADIQLQMHSNMATKAYLLICRGHTPASGVINHPLKPLDDFKSKALPIKNTKPALEAISEFARLDTIELDVAIDKYPSSRYSLVKVKILTGRRHQIRRHMKHLSHPIIGCPKYGKSIHNRYFATTFDVSRLLLHSYQMSLEHPVTKQPLLITAEPLGGFKSLMQRFGWQLP